MRAVVDYCTEHYGPLSFGAGDSLKLIQSRVAGGGYAADGASLLDEDGLHHRQPATTPARGLSPAR